MSRRNDRNEVKVSAHDETLERGLAGNGSKAAAEPRSAEMRSAGARPASSYRPELDCLRFFAFLAVFVHHSFPSTADFYQSYHLPVALANIPYAGAFGVDLFFCLSAYLITELLVREKNLTGHLNVRAFYIRRMLRIWPLYFTFVLFAFGVSFVDHSQKFSATNLALFLVLAGNWAAATGTVLSFVIPLWSVSIEEQFYLLWPLAVRRAGRTQMLGICVAMIVIAFAWRAALAGWMNQPDALIWNGTFGHLDSIAYGIILSLMDLRQNIPAWSRTLLFSMGTFAWLFAAGIRDHVGIAPAFVALGSVAILRSAIGLRLNNPILVRLGIVSYGLYVYHRVFLIYINQVLPADLPRKPRFLLWWSLSLAATTITAMASYRWLESPFLRFKERFAVVKSRPV